MTKIMREAAKKTEAEVLFDLIEAAKTLVALWYMPKISSLPRQERNAAIAGAREDLVQAVKALTGRVRIHTVEAAAGYVPLKPRSPSRPLSDEAAFEAWWLETGADYCEASGVGCLVAQHIWNAAVRAAVADASASTLIHQRTAYYNRINVIGGQLDEVVLYGVAHLEQMSADSWFLSLTREDGSGYGIWLSRRRKSVKAMWEEREGAPLSRWDADSGNLSAAALATLPATEGLCALTPKEAEGG
jgi:hypothetical protein